MSVFNEIKVRLTWLLVGLVASLMIAHVISNFEHILHENIILASFMPLIVYMSDAVGTQMEAMIIRELNKKSKFRFGQFIRWQLTIIAPVAIIIGVIAAAALQIWHGDSSLSYTVGVALFTSIMSSLITGAVMPYFFWRLHEDPAEASGPVATVLQDLLSIVVYFYVAQLFFR